MQYWDYKRVWATGCSGYRRHCMVIGYATSDVSTFPESLQYLQETSECILYAALYPLRVFQMELRRMFGSKKYKVNCIMRKIWGSHGGGDEVVTPCGLAGRYQRFGETILSSSSRLKWETVCFSKALVFTCESTRRHNSEQQHCHMHMRSFMIVLFNKYYWGDQIKDVEVGGATGRREMDTQF
jgi:hypothetical protein